MLPKLPVLSPDDTIAIVAPAGRVKIGDLDFAKDWILAQGWNYKIADRIDKFHSFGYNYSGTKKERLYDLQVALDDKSIKAIWCARGGYGSIHLVDELDFSVFIKKPKWFIGYSDVTVIHNKINSLGFPSLHAVTAKQLSPNQTKESYSTLKKVLQREALSYNMKGSIMNQEGYCRAKLWGGNLSMLYSQLGSKTVSPIEDYILFIEDWKENWYHLDRMLMALKRTGAFDNVVGLIVGSFTHMDTLEENKEYNQSFDITSNQIVKTFFEDLNIPIIYDFPAGHINNNLALILGQEIELKVTEHQFKIQF